LAIEDLDIDSIGLIDEIFNEVSDKDFHNSHVKVVLKNTQFTTTPYLDASGYEFFRYNRKNLPKLPLIFYL
jgi:hypothetical protein